MRMYVNIVNKFYCATAILTLLYASVAFYGLLAKRAKSDLEKPSKACLKLIQKIDHNYYRATPNFLNLYKVRLNFATNRIIANVNHPLNSYFSFLPSGRRMRMLACKKKKCIILSCVWELGTIMI